MDASTKNEEMDNPSPGSSGSGVLIMKGECANITTQSDLMFSCESYYPPVTINRTVVNQLDLYSKLQDSDSEDADEAACCSSLRNRMRRMKRSCLNCNPERFMKRRIPILEWLPKYSWKEDLLSDLTAGFTVAVMHVPQGMAYALLADIPPIVGIYMAFFPIFIYTMLGTSRHVSMGTFAVICLMTGKVVNAVIHDHEIEGGTSPYTPIQIATIVSFVAGLSQIAMGVLRLGAVSLLLSPSLVGGFTTGAAIHVLTSQVKNFFGIQLPRRSGIFKIPMTYYDIASHISETNLTTVIVSAVTVIVLTIYNELMKPFISKRCKIPLPVELIAVIIGTLVSYYMDLHGNYGVTIIENIPTGLPIPTPPPFELLPEVIVDSVVIAFVAYAISISMAKIFAKKHSYNVDADQELLAQGSSNIFGSFFSCAPVAVSLSRSLVQDIVGGKTQLTSLFSCLFLLLVLLLIGPLFESLPNCVLAGIIVVALKGMFMQATELPRYWRNSVLHGLVWLLSFLATVLLDIPYGLAVGLFMTTVMLLWRSNRTEVTVLGRYVDSDLYIDLKSNENVREIQGVKIIKFVGNLNFATIEKFVEAVFNIVHVDWTANNAFSNQQNLKKMQSLSSTLAIAHADHNQFAPDDDHSRIEFVILDFSSASSIGPGSVNALSQLHSSLEKAGIEIYYAGCPLTVIHELRECGFLQKYGRGFLFPTVHDAVIVCKSHDTKTLPSLNKCLPSTDNP